MSSCSPHEILTPTWRILTNVDMENTLKTDEIEDISDEMYIRRHIRCELEQETWIPSSSNTNRKSGSTSFHSSLSLPNGVTH